MEKNYKTLLERLKPELKQALDQQEEKYPHTIRDIKDALSAHFGVTFLTYGILMGLESVAHSNDIPFSLSNPWLSFEED